MLKEVILDRPEFTSEGSQPVVEDIRDQLVEPFIESTRAALGEMAGTELVVRAVYQKAIQYTLGDLATVLRLQSATEEFLVLGFPEQTAAALARRILAGVTEEVDASLIRDCMGEIANVVAGQAKAKLADTPYHFTFSLPEVVVGAKDLRPQQGLDCLVIAFNSDLGEFVLQLFLIRLEQLRNTLR
jgi:chemotaxis protein CheX